MEKKCYYREKCIYDFILKCLNTNFGILVHLIKEFITPNLN